MIAYRALRRVVLCLRSVQTALLGASFLVSDYAGQAGQRAKVAARASIDKSIDKVYDRVARLGRVADEAQARFEEAADEAGDIQAEFEERRAMIEREVL